jgi:ketosteroid isomerase-like protein
MTEARFLEFFAAWERRDLEAVMRSLDDHCVYEGAEGPEPGRTAVGREAVRHTLKEQFAVEAGDILVASPFVCGARGMVEWTAFLRQADGRPILQRGCDWFEFHDDQIRRISGFRKVEHQASHPLDKSALLTHIRASYDRFQARLAPLSEAQLTTPGAIGTWSIKDVLAHLTAWHELGAKEYQAIVQGQAPLLEPEGEVDQDNARLIEPYRTQSLHEVQAAFRTAFQQVVEAVERLSETDLFEADRFLWRGGHALWEGIANNTFAHYDEHAGMIAAWLDTVG